MFSCILNGCIFPIKGFECKTLSQIISYLKIALLLIIKSVVNGCDAVKINAPFGFTILNHSFHNNLKLIAYSHLQAVVLYGGSVSIKSIKLSGIRFIVSMQSSLYILFLKSTFNHSF